MNPYSTVPEHILEELEKTALTENKPGYSIRDYNQVVADLAQLYQQLDMVTDILEKIRDSVAVLQQSLGAHQ